MKRPAVAASVSWIGGMGGAAMGMAPVPAPAVIAASLLWAVWFALVNRRAALRWGLLAALVVAGNTYYHIRDNSLSSAIPTPTDVRSFEAEGADAAIAGRIASIVETDGDRAVFYLLADEWAWSGEDPLPEHKERIYVSIRLASPEERDIVSEWRRGDRLSLSGTVRMPETARNFGGFDFRNYLRSRQVYWIVSVQGIAGLTRSGPEGWSFDRLLRLNDLIRAKAGEKLDLLFPGEEAGYMKGLLTGAREDLDPDRMRDFSRLGLTHILAISGLHVGVFLWAVTALCRRLGFTKETTYRVAFWTIPQYVLFTGSSPSIVRAGIMSMAALLAARKGWLKDGLSLLGAAALGMLLINPHYIVDAGFQLSFLVTAGLIIWSPIAGSLLPLKNKLVNSSLSVAVTAQLVSFPLSVYYFNQFSLFSLAANVVLVPVISFVVIPLGYGLLLISFPFPSAAVQAASAVSWMNRATFRCVEQASALPFGQLIWPSPSFWWIAAYYALLAAGLAITQRTQQLKRQERGGVYLLPDGPWRLKRNAAVSRIAAVLFLLLLAYGYSPYRFTERGKGLAAFLDVGQGDAAYVRTPGGKHLLIDGGGTLSFGKEGEEWRERSDPYEVGKKTVVPLLKKRGVHKLDYIIISHEDADHIGGLPAVLEEIPVGAILFNGTLKTSAAAEKLFRLAVSKNIPLVPVSQGNILALDPDTELVFLSPAANGQGSLIRAEKQNEAAVAVLLTMNSRSFLLTGDMGAEQELELLQGDGGHMSKTVMEGSGASPALPLPPGGVDVLKVAHHGSKNSSSDKWLSFWQPQLSVISVGKSNVYGHPHPLTLERLKDNGSLVLRTDLDGEIQFLVEGREMLVRTKLE